MGQFPHFVTAVTDNSSMLVAMHTENIYNDFPVIRDSHVHQDRKLPTLADYNEFLIYNAETGGFTWRKSPSPRYKAGQEVGMIKSRKDEYGVLRQYRYIGLFGQQISASKIVWLMTTGHWPTSNIQFKDKNSLNLRFDNLERAPFPAVKVVGKNGKTQYRMPRDQNRKYGLLRYYGLTMEAYNLMLAAQGGVCAICKGNETYKPKSYTGVKALSVDHDHVTGEIRGLVCSCCNYVVGHCREDRNILLAAIAYLDKHSATPRKRPELSIVPKTEEVH